MGYPGIPKYPGDFAQSPSAYRDPVPRPMIWNFRGKRAAFARFRPREPPGVRTARALACAALGFLLLFAAAPATATADRTPASLPPAGSCVAPILPCYIFLSIASGSHGNRENVTGAHFWPGEPFTVYFWNGVPGVPAAIVASGSTGTGGFSATFPIPKGVVGNYVVFVTDLAGDNQSAPFHLTELRASPSTGNASNTTSVSGSGFLPDHVVKFHVHGASANATAPCRTNRSGDFRNCVLTIPVVPTGPTRLIGSDGTYFARIDFTVG